MENTPRRKSIAAVVAYAIFAQLATPLAYGFDRAHQTEHTTATPIKHVIVLIGENRTYDHTFGTYRPKRGRHVSNLLSKRIVRADGSLGRHFNRSTQFTVPPQPAYYIAAPSKTPYDVLPPPTTAGASPAPSDVFPPFRSLQTVAIERDIAPQDLVLLTTGATGLPQDAVDTRVTNAANLPSGPYQLTGPTMPYDAYTGDTTHRFYQMWQQSDCSTTHATFTNPTGCLSDLYPFVITTYTTRVAGGGNSMGFFNVNNGDLPFLKALADTFASSDNFHQSVQGGTGANHIMLGFGDVIFWSDGQGNAVPPPANLVADPNPQPGTNNLYTVDGNWSNCADPTQPGVGPIRSYLASLRYHPRPNCAPGHFYMLNNTNPAFLPNGRLRSGGTFVPPSNLRSIGDALSDKDISWRFYGGAFNAAVNLADGSTNPLDVIGVTYCNICNPFQFETSIMTDPAVRAEHLKDTADLFSDIENGTLPAVAFAHPDGLLDGHPETSKLDLFEAYARNILNKLDANPSLRRDTAVFITFDEGGGYYDSGFIQPLDFFGDGPRIPLIAISAYSHGGRIVHSYADHVSILKFIERNWRLRPITNRSRDNLPNPIALPFNPYVPLNMPAIGDLFDMFDFRHFDAHARFNPFPDDSAGVPGAGDTPGTPIDLSSEVDEG